MLSTDSDVQNGDGQSFQRSMTNTYKLQFGFYLNSRPADTRSPINAQPLDHPVNEKTLLLMTSVSFKITVLC